MSVREKFQLGMPLVWRKSCLFNGEKMVPGAAVDQSSIAPIKLRSLYRSRHLDPAPEEVEVLPVVLIVPEALADHSDPDIVMALAVGEMDPMDWNAMEPHERDEVVLALLAPEQDEEAPEQDDASEE